MGSQNEIQPKAKETHTFTLDSSIVNFDNTTPFKPDQIPQFS